MGVNANQGKAVKRSLPPKKRGKSKWGVSPNKKDRENELDFWKIPKSPGGRGVEEIRVLCVRVELTWKGDDPSSRENGPELWGLTKCES